MEQIAADRVARLAAEVRAEVARQRIPQHVIGAHLELDQRAVSRRLLGQVEWTALQLTSLAALLGVEVSKLLGETAASA